MEQKKLLLIAISVGVFFVIAIGAALVAFNPQGELASAAGPKVTGTSYTSPGDSSYQPLNSGAAEPATVNAQDYLRDGVQGLQAAPLTVENSSLSAGGPVQTPPETPSDNSGRTLITVDPKSAAGVPNVSVAPKKLTAPQARPAGTKPAAGVKPAVRAKPAAEPASPSAIRDDYWVQTGAFTAMSRAEGVKQSLAEKGITSIIENRDVEGTTYFRVRVGPYTSQNEADYWLSLIKSIGGFEDSQVRKTQTRL